MFRHAMSDLTLGTRCLWRGGFCGAPKSVIVLLEVIAMSRDRFVFYILAVIMVILTSVQITYHSIVFRCLINSSTLLTRIVDV